MVSSSSSSPCAACKLLRRKCTQECVFAPYFPPDEPQKFADVHKVFGASNVTKILNDLPQFHRPIAVTTLAQEADARIRDPIYGCVARISMLQSHLRQIHAEIGTIQLELSKYLGPHLQIGPSSSSLGFTIALGNKSTGTPPPQLNFLDVQSMGTPPPQLNFLDVQNQQQQLLAEQQHQEMISSYDGDVARMNAAAAAAVTGTSTSPVTGFDGGYGGQGALGFMGPYVQQSRVSFENGFEPKIIGTQFETGFEEKMAGSGRDAVQ